jgi:hypothetical protein
MKTGPLAFLLAAGCFAAVPAEAEEFYRQDAWEVDIDDFNGRPRCSIRNDDYREFLQIYYERGADHLSLQIGSDDWDLPSGRRYAYRMQFDEGRRWDAEAVSGHYRDGGSYIDVDLITRDQMSDWLEQFATSHYLTISFPGTDIRPWILDLSGTRNVVDKFQECMDNYTS